MANHPDASRKRLLGEVGLTHLTCEMDACWRLLDELPNDQTWTQGQLAALDDVRHAALRLANVVEVTIQDLQEHRPSNG